MQMVSMACNPVRARVGHAVRVSRFGSCLARSYERSYEWLWSVFAAETEIGVGARRRSLC